MAGSVQATPGFALQPSATRQTLSTNYITNFDFLNQYLPDTYEKNSNVTEIVLLHLS